MSRYGAPDPETRAWCDIVCRKVAHEQMDGWFTVWLVGADHDRLIGQLCRDSYYGWSAISLAPPECLQGYRMTRGFKRRWFAIEYLLRAWKGIYPDDGLGSSSPGPTPDVHAVND